MEVHEAIRQRRAVRAYAPILVSEAAIRRLLEAAVHAPSAMNAQPWVFVVVQEAEALKRLSDRAKAALLAGARGEAKAQRYADLLADPKFDIFYDAGALVVICAPEGPFCQADCWLAAQNLMLAATAEGLGTCPIGFAVGVLNEPATKAELGIPADLVAVAPIIVGVPRVTPPPVARAAPRVASWLGPRERAA